MVYKYDMQLAKILLCKYPDLLLVACEFILVPLGGIAPSTLLPAPQF